MVEIRTLNESNLDGWLKLRRKLWPSATRTQHRGEVRELMQSDNFIAWAAWHGIEAIGFLELYVRPFANGCDSRPVPFLEGIWVDSSWRSKGIGRQLLHAAVNWARSEGFTEMGSDADLDNTVSHQAHSAWGFVETERVIYFRKKL
ncbi:MAG: GNAT family N-acetyltransferase [SAR324 cluster bacterium]|nr:GNAT family N-acetyltransferase [SAR324 cluster bacterium]